MLNIRHKGFLLAIEGPDGAGKSTVRDWLAEWFGGHGINAVLTREPGGTPAAEQIREEVLRTRKCHEEPLTGLAKTLLFMASRAQHIENLIKPRLEVGELVITDRFCDSTFAYQSQEGVDLSQLRFMHDAVFNNFKPDLTILLDGDPEVFRARMADRGEDAVNYYDLKPIEWHHACRKIYKDCVRGDGNRYAVIDAEQSFEQVQAQLIPHLMKIDAHLRKRPVTAEA